MVENFSEEDFWQLPMWKVPMTDDEKIMLGFLAWWRDEWLLHKVGPVSVKMEDYFGDDLPKVYREMIAETFAIVREARIEPYFTIRTQAKLLHFCQRDDVQTEDDMVRLLLIVRLMDIYRRGVLHCKQEIADLLMALGLGRCRDYLAMFWADLLPEE